jgi:hypothetical protein
MILIGSKAIKHHFPDFPREPNDTDYVLFEYQNYGVIKTPGVEYLHNKIISDKYHQTDKKILEPNDLATLKASHLCWNINWDKHMFDLQFLLKKGCDIDNALFFDLYAHWNTYHEKNKRSDLKMTKEDFFDNNINYDENQHDDLHKILNPVPVYTLTLKDGQEVELDEEKFNRLSREQKLDFVREEVMVMAYERYAELDYRVAYYKMLKKFIISHAPMFSLTFILKNFIELHKPKINYIKKINDGKSKTIK